MNLDFLRKKHSEVSNSSDPHQDREISLIPEQHVTAPPTLKLVAWAREKNPESIKSEFQMTIRTKVTKLTDKQASMLLKVLSVLALRDGIDIIMYMSMEHLRNILTRQSSHAIELIPNEKDRQALLLSELILQNVRGEWLSFSERIQIPRHVIEEIVASGWLPDKRTFYSWLDYWQPEKFLEFRIVPLEYLIDRSGYSNPYSAYCKGYGEGGHAAREKTRYSSELDGEPVEDDFPPGFNLLEVRSYQRILLAIEQAKTERIQGNGNR